MQIKPETLPMLLENRRNGSTLMCRVRVEVLLKHPQLFDRLYDIAEERLGGPLCASQTTDVATNLKYVYFWNAASRVLIQNADPAVAA